MKMRTLHVMQSLALVVGTIGLEKLIVATVALVGVTVLGLVGRLEGQAVITIYSVVLGYILGAGTATSKAGDS